VERERYRLADLEIDASAAAVRRGAEAIELPRLSFDLLLALVRRAPAVVSFDELIDEVWDGAAVADETLTQRVGGEAIPLERAAR
jgi:DNA-binding winged helix-turn-helix (wHTH) protein